MLPQTLKSRGNIENNKSAIRLYEIGPRMTIELIKIQNDLFTGEVLYHNTIVKTEEEIAEMKRAREEKKRLKELRKKAQTDNVAKKEKHKEDHKKRSAAGKSDASAYQNDKDEGVDNDADYYRDEVGEDPDEGKGKCLWWIRQFDGTYELAANHFSTLCITDLFQTSITSGGRKRPFIPKHMKAKDAKRRKLGDEKSGDGKPKKFKSKKDAGGDKGARDTKKFDKKSSDAPAKKTKKVKPKKTKGKKKSHRNKNK